MKTIVLSAADGNGNGINRSENSAEAVIIHS
jgi:hypothetical protein